MAVLVRRRPGEVVAYHEGVSSAYRYMAAHEETPRGLKEKLEALLTLNESMLRQYKEANETALALDSWNPNESEEH